MFPSSMDIIDLSSDSEGDIIDLSSDSEENNDFLSYIEDDADYEDPVSPSLLLGPPSTAPDQNSMEHPTGLKYNDWLISTQPSSSCSPVESRSTTEMGSKATNIFPPVNQSYSIAMPHDSAHAIPKNEQHIDNVGAVYVSNDIKRTPLPISNGIAAKSENFYAPNVQHQFPQHFTNGGSRSFNPQSFASVHPNLGDNGIKEDPAVKYSHPNLGDNRIKEETAVRFSHPNLGDNEIKEDPAVKHSPTVRFSHPNLGDNGIKEDPAVKYSHPNLGDNRIKEETAVRFSHPNLGDNEIKEDPAVKYSPTVKFSHQNLGDNGIKEDPAVKYSHPNLGDNRIKEEPAVRFSHPNLGDNRIREDPAVKFSGLQRCTANGNAIFPSTEPTDDLFVYGGPRPHRIFPPPLPSTTPVNDAKDDNDIEKRLFGFTERVVYEEALENINQERGEEDLPEGVMSISLLKHQKMALAWMLWKENSSYCPGGILADDQGLGKTVSTIALIQKERVKQSKFMTAGSSCTKSVPNMRSKTRPAAGTLVVCPASVLRQWANELSVKVTGSAKLTVLIYHGGSRTRDPNELATYDVVVTTYMTVANEVPKENSDEQKESEMWPKFSAGSKRKQPSSKPKKIKKPNNSDGGPLARVRWFRVVLDEAQTIKNYRTHVSKACCGLRAERRWCLSGTPIQNKIDDLYSYFCFLKYEPYSKFASFRDMIKHQISRDAVRGYKKLQAILRIILLRRTKETLIDGEPILKLPPKTIQLIKIDFTQEERAFYLTLEEGSRQKFKAYDDAGTIRENYANILVLLLRLRQACDHPILLKGKESDLIDNSSIEMAKQLPKETVTDLLEKLEIGPAICSICSEPPEDAVVAKCGHVFCQQCVHDILTSDRLVCPNPLCGKNINVRSVFTPAVLKLCILPKLEFHQTTSCSTAEKPPSICETSYISSKIRAAVDILDSIINTRALTMGESTKLIPNDVSPVKAIIFSQWTGMLDLLELSLTSKHIQFRRLDGAMSLNLREIGVKEFNTDPEVRVMLMSLKAGNLGLNMVAASHVIMLDPWWNPYAEDQAVDRAHRIGQTRPVTVSRFTVKDTVEDRILALQEKKRKMVQSAFGEDSSGGNATRLTVEDLRYLFMV